MEVAGARVVVGWEAVEKAATDLEAATTVAKAAAAKEAGARAVARTAAARIL